MCWSMQATIGMAAVGTIAAVITYRRRDPPAIWLTLGFFAAMEALQIAGYSVVNQCGTTANQSVTVLSYLHIVIQPFFINAFAMELVPDAVKRRVRAGVFAVCAVSSLVMLAQIIPAQQLGTCLPGSALCANRWCTVSGDWHIAWDVPYNGILVSAEQIFGINSGFPTYMVAAFILPLVYGAWRFVIVHAVAGPILAANLTTNANEMPAIWCLFSIAILLISLSPAVRQTVSTTRWWGRSIASH
jgi:hypothetical protein